MPADIETLCLYSQFLSRSFKSTSAIKNYISGIKTMHYLLGFSVDHINDFLLNLSIRGIVSGLTRRTSRLEKKINETSRIPPNKKKINSWRLGRFVACVESITN